MSCRLLWNSPYTLWHICIADGQFTIHFTGRKDNQVVTLVPVSAKEPNKVHLAFKAAGLCIINHVEKGCKPAVLLSRTCVSEPSTGQYSVWEYNTHTGQFRSEHLLSSKSYCLAVNAATQKVVLDVCDAQVPAIKRSERWLFLAEK